MPFYCDLFDTARRTGRERAVARTLLQLRTVVGPVDLTAIHAANSEFILDDCASDENFLALVAEGRIRFRRRHDGMTARDWLTRYLNREDAWSIWGNSMDEHQDVLATIRDTKRALTTNGRRRVLLENRIERANRLWSAYDASRAPVEEPVGDSFRIGMGAVLQRIPAQLPQVIRVIRELHELRRCNDRTTVYGQLDAFGRNGRYAGRDIVAARE